jgi:Zn-dependent M16 (insulinase) family peptidase
MKTWAAGLAYSNGYSINAGSGRVGYYAERCPDVAATMRFVVDQLKNAEDDPSLTDYAIAQEFGYSRAPSRYEDRGEAMASDLADGITPDVVRLYRQKVLDLRNMNDLYDQLKSRMQQAYGQVLIGYGPPLSKSKDATFFLIGPEQQFESLQDYIGNAEGKQEVYRLYPRDFWLTM